MTRVNPPSSARQDRKKQNGESSLLSVHRELPEGAAAARERSIARFIETTLGLGFLNKTAVNPKIVFIRTMPIYCIVPACGAVSAAGSRRMFHLVPKESDLCKEWLEAIGLKRCEEEVQKKRTSYRVCSDHFDESSYETKLVLLPDARPSRRPPTSATEDIVTNVETIVDTESVADTDTNSYDTNMQVQKEYLEINSECDDPLEMNEPDMCTEIDMKILQTGTNNLEKTRLKTHTTNETFLECCSKILGVKPMRFIKWQILLRTRQKTKGAGKFKQFCLGLYYRNPRAYSILQNFIDLPSINTLRRSYISISAGYINPQCMKLLDIIVEKMTAKDRCCIVGVGSTRLRKHLYYDIRNDTLHGLHQVDDKLTPKPAKKAFVLIAKGLFTTWRLPVAYALFSDFDGYALVFWADTVIQTLVHKGLDVRAFISNHTDEDSKRASQVRNITRDKNFSVLTNKKIYHIFDVCCLIRSLRDSFMSFDFKIGRDVAKWDHIVSFYNVEAELQTHLTSKLTEAHVRPEGAARASAALAAQTFSQALATAMDLFARLRLLDPAAAATVKLVSTLNDLFDLLNSNSLQNKTAYKRAYTGEKWQKKFLSEAIRYFKTIKRDTKGEYVTDEIEAIEGFIVTMKSVKNLWKDLSNDGFTYLLTRPLSIEFVDDFFLEMNSQNGVRNQSSLTSIQFNRLLYKSFICHAIRNAKLQSPGTISSTISLLEEYIATEASEKIEIKAIIVGDPDYKISLPKTNAIQFIAGYLMRKALDKHSSCKKLMRYLNPTESELIQIQGHYINYEYFEENSEIPKSLKLSVDFIAFVVKMEETFLEVFQRERLPQRAGAAVLRAAADLVVLPCSCFPLFLIKKLFVRLRIYNTLKIANRQFKLRDDIDIFEVNKLDI